VILIEAFGMPSTSRTYRSFSSSSSLSVVAATFSRHSSSSQSFMAEFSTPSLLRSSPPAFKCHDANNADDMTEAEIVIFLKTRTTRRNFFSGHPKIIMLPCRW
jgi:hypothetical protein